MKSINRFVYITLFISVTMGMIGLAFFTPEINKEVSEGKNIIQKSRDRIDLCELLNWDSYYVDHDFLDLDWYVAAMIEDSLITESEANITINKFLIDNLRKVSETRGRSDVDEYYLFQGISEIFIEWYVVVLYEEEQFLYNHTYELLVYQYGENTDPFILQFNTSLMTNLVDDYETKNIIPLETCGGLLFYSNALLIGIIPLIGLWEFRRKELGKRSQKFDTFFIVPITLTVISSILMLSGLYQIFP